MKMENKEMFFGSNIKWWRKQNKMSQTEFAKLINKKTSTVSSYENAISVPSLGVITHIALLMGYSVEQLMYMDFREDYSFLDDNLNDNVRDNLKHVNTLKMDIDKYPNSQDLKMLISIEQWRIREVQDLIKVIVEKYGMNSDEKVIFRNFNSKLRHYSKIDLSNYELGNYNLDELKIYEEKLHSLLFSLYEDLFTITNTYHIIMEKQL